MALEFRIQYLKRVGNIVEIEELNLTLLRSASNTFKLADVLATTEMPLISRWPKRFNMVHQLAYVSFGIEYENSIGACRNELLTSTFTLDAKCPVCIMTVLLIQFKLRHFIKIGAIQFEYQAVRLFTQRVECGSTDEKE